MIVFRATNPIAMDYIADDLLRTSAKWYKEQMMNNGDNTCVIIIYDNNKAVGHIVARIIYNPAQDIRYCWVDSLKHDVDGNIGLGGMIDSKDVLVNWCKNKGVSQIRGYVYKDNPLFDRGIYGAEVLAKIFVKEI